MTTIDLSRRGFFGATTAALVAMLAPRKAYSFLNENPLASPPGIMIASFWASGIRLDTVKVPRNGSGVYSFRMPDIECTALLEVVAPPESMPPTTIVRTIGDRCIVTELRDCPQLGIVRVRTI